MEKMIQVATEAAQDAGQVIQDGFKNFLKISKKPDKTFLTQIDLKAEELIVKTIRKHFPFHAILSEETEKELNNSKYLWVIDPLDGTRNFVHRIPIVAVSIALIENSVPKIGIIYQPFTGEMFFAEKGKGAFLNNSRIRVSKIIEISETLGQIGTITGSRFNIEGIKSFRDLAPKVNALRTIGSAAISLAYLAAGRFDFHLDYNINWWDIAAGFLLIEETGGKITTIDGEKLKAGDKKFDILASNGLIHSEILNLINKKGATSISRF